MENLGQSLRTWILGLSAALAIAWPDPLAAKSSEVLFVYPPNGWQLGLETRVGKLRTYEYVPAGQTVTGWTDSITVQIMEGKRDLSPTDLARSIRTRFIADCGAVEHRGPERLNLGGYLAARLYLECTDPIKKRRPGGAPFRKYEGAAFQIVQGKSDLYVIERAWHGDTRAQAGAPYGRADLWGWDGFWHGIEVCDAEARTRPCFGLGLLSPEKADIFVSRVDPVLPYGCDYFRIVTIMPDLSRPAKPTVVIPVKLGLGPFGDSKGEQTFVAELLGAYQDNRPAAVILTLSRKALARIFPTDAGKTERDAAMLKTLLVAAGVDAERLYEAVNPACAGG